MERKDGHSLESHVFPFGSQGLFIKRYFDEQTCRQKVFKSATSATPNARTWSQQTRWMRSLQSSPGRYVMNLGTFPLSRDHREPARTGPALPSRFMWNNVYISHCTNSPDFIWMTSVVFIIYNKWHAFKIAYWLPAWLVSVLLYMLQKAWKIISTLELKCARVCLLEGVSDRKAFSYIGNNKATCWRRY